MDEMIKYFNTLLEALRCAVAPNAGVADDKDSFLPFYQCCKMVSKSVNIVPFCVLIAVDNQYNFKKLKRISNAFFVATKKGW